MKIEIKSSTGLYAVNVNGSIADAKAEELCMLGLQHGLLARGVFAPARELVGSARKLEDCKPYDEEKAKKLKEMIANALAGYGTFAIECPEYVPGEGATPKFADAKKRVASKGGDAVRLRAMADAVGYTGTGMLDVENEDFLRAITDFVKNAI